MVKDPNILLRRLEDQELRIYFFIGTKREDGLPFMIGDKKIIYVAGFKLEEAFDLATKMVGKQFRLLYTGQNPTVREFLYELELEATAYTLLVRGEKMVKKEECEIKLAPELLGFEKFKSGLLFCANESDIIYKRSEDKKDLQRIISGLRYLNKNGGRSADKI